MLPCLFAVAFSAASFRPPSVPLVVVDPYLSIWSNADSANANLPQHWTTTMMPIVIMAKVDDATVMLVGQDTFSCVPPEAENVAQRQPCLSGVPPAKQTRTQVDPTQTILTYETNGVELTLTFTTPSFADDVPLTGMGTSFIAFRWRPLDQKTHKVEYYYENTAEIAVDSTGQEVTWGRGNLSNTVFLRVGSTAQKVLGKAGDFEKIGWGYAYIAPLGNSSFPVQTGMGSWRAMATGFVTNAKFPKDEAPPRPANNNWPVLVARWDLSSDPSGGEVGIAILYDQIASMDFYGEFLKPSWSLQFKNAESALQYAVDNAQKLQSRAAEFNRRMISALTQAGGERYALMCSLAYRQVMGSMVMTVPSSAASASAPDTPIWAFMKEISSDGDVSTVDVLYPASPMLLWLNPDLLRIALLPILAHSNNETNIKYNLAWAPHHLGVWPKCNLKPQDQEQMPMEESGNMLLMLYAIYKAGSHDLKYLDPYWKVLGGWADYLVSTLPNPPAQLCTDDFMGPAPNNTNLAIKGILGVQAYAELRKAVGDSAAYDKYSALVQGFVKYWLNEAFEAGSPGGHYRREYPLKGSYSLKYNLLYHQVLEMGVFPNTVQSTELDYYAAHHNNTYGFPLDDRQSWTLVEYLGALLAVTDSPTHRTTITNALFAFLNTTPQRVPMTDWYDSKNARQSGFQARSTVGDLFSLAWRLVPAPSSR